jgi:glycosyltransferase involved in cell wall biosynthesis
MRVGYIWGRTIPSRETDTQQVLKTVDALAWAGAQVELVVPAAAAARSPEEREHFEQAVRAFYGTTGPFELVPMAGLPPSPLELERPVHSVVAMGRVRSEGYDLVYTRSRAVLLGCVASGQRVVFETYRMLGHDSPRFARVLALAARSESLLGVIVHSKQAAQSLAAAGVPERKLATVYNGFDPDDLEPRRSRREARAELGLSEKSWTVAYTGHVRANKGIAAILEVATLTPELAYRLVGGDAGSVEALRAEVKARGLQNVQVPGWFPARELGVQLFAADALIIPPTAAPLEQYGRTVLPMKLFTYLATGRPIVAPDTRDLRELLVDGDNAVLVASDDANACARALYALRDDPERGQRLARSAQALAEGFSWRARGERVLEQLVEWQGRAAR